MAEYLILIYSNEAAFESYTQDAWGELMEAHNRFAEQIVEELLGIEHQCLQNWARAETCTSRFGRRRRRSRMLTLQ